MRVIKFFNCEEYGTEHVLANDVSTLCFNTLWLRHIPLAIAGVIIFTLGVPCLFLYLMTSARNRAVNYTLHLCLVHAPKREHMLKEASIDADINGEYFGTPIDLKAEIAAIKQFLERRNMRSHLTYSQIGMIYYAYREGAWYYEIVELSRKFMLNGVMVLLAPGTTSQIICGLMVCFVYLMVVMITSPYDATSDHLLASLCHMQLFLSLWCGMMLQSNIDFLPQSKWPDPGERKELERTMVAWVAVLSHSGLLLWGLAAIVWERFFSKEIKQLHRRKQLRDKWRKQKLAKARTTSMRMFMSNKNNNFGGGGGSGSGSAFGNFGSKQLSTTEKTSNNLFTNKDKDDDDDEWNFDRISDDGGLLLDEHDDDHDAAGEETRRAAQVDSSKKSRQKHTTRSETDVLDEHDDHDAAGRLQRRRWAVEKNQEETDVLFKKSSDDIYEL